MISSSLADPTGSSPFVAAVQWIEGVALGTVATSIALIAVASVGFLMLSGRFPARRGLIVIAGCFTLFGASAIAQGVLKAATSGSQIGPQIQPSTPPPPPTVKSIPGYDPYAGAAVPPN